MLAERMLVPAACAVLGVVAGVLASIVLMSPEAPQNSDVTDRTVVTTVSDGDESHVVARGSSEHGKESRTSNVTTQPPLKTKNAPPKPEPVRESTTAENTPQHVPVVPASSGDDGEVPAVRTPSEKPDGETKHDWKALREGGAGWSDLVKLGASWGDLGPLGADPADVAPVVASDDALAARLGLGHYDFGGLFTSTIREQGNATVYAVLVARGALCLRDLSDIDNPKLKYADLWNMGSRERLDGASWLGLAFEDGAPKYCGLVCNSDRKAKSQKGLIFEIDKTDASKSGTPSSERLLIERSGATVEISPDLAWVMTLNGKTGTLTHVAGARADLPLGNGSMIDDATFLPASGATRMVTAERDSFPLIWDPAQRKPLAVFDMGLQDRWTGNRAYEADHIIRNPHQANAGYMMTTTSKSKSPTKSASGAYLYSSVASLWDVEQRTWLGNIEFSYDYRSHDTMPIKPGFGPRLGQYLVPVTPDEFHVLAVGNKNPVVTFKGYRQERFHYRQQTGVGFGTYSFNATGSHIAISATDAKSNSQILVFSATTGRLLHVLKGARRENYSTLVWHPDGRHILAFSGQSTIFTLPKALTDDAEDDSGARSGNEAKVSSGR